MENLFQVIARAQPRLAGGVPLRAGSGACLLLLLLSFTGTGLAAQTNKVKKAQLKISGYGLLGNFDAKRTLKTLELGGRKPEFFGPAFIEDAALILTARVKRDGYLQPIINIEMDLDEGGHMRIRADELTEHPLPRPLRVKRVHFFIHKGVLYHFKELQFENLEALPEKKAAAFFVESGTLFRLKSNRVYTPERMRRGTRNLTEELERAGYEQAKVTVARLQIDEKTGAVKTLISVHQGPKAIVRSVRQEFFYGAVSQPAETRTSQPNQPYSKLWLQDFTQSIKTNLYRRGYPDAFVETRTLKREGESQIDLELLATVKTGPRVWLGDVGFQGEKKTVEPLMERRARVKEGHLFDRVKVEDGRTRLAQLGVFDTVDLEIEPVDDQTRSVLYRVKEGKHLDFNLLFGYGSYELLRGGFEVEQFNIWGRAHHARLKAVQSFKASTADFTYTLPEVIGED